MDRQRDDCLALVEREGWELVGIYTDNDLSASRYASKKRPEYEKAVQLVRDGGVDRLVAWATDRLYRRPSDLEELIDLADAGRVTVTTLHGDIDLSTSTGRQIARVLGASSAAEADHLSERKRRANEQLREKGLPTGRHAAFGWRDPMRPDPAQARIVNELTDRLLAGETMTALANDLNRRDVLMAQGGRGRWAVATVRSILTSPRNAGMVAHNGESVGEAQWPAIVDRTKWERVQSKLSAGRVAKQPKRRTLLTGLVKCVTCGETMTRSSNNKSVSVWRCRKQPDRRNCGHNLVIAKPIEELVTEAVLQRLEVSALGRPVKKKKSKKADDPEAVLVEVDARLDELAEMFAAGEMTRRQVQVARKSLDDRREVALCRVVADSGTEALAGMTGVEAREAWDAAPLDRQRAVLAAIIDRVAIEPAQRQGQRFDPNRLDIEWAV